MFVCVLLCYVLSFLSCYVMYDAYDQETWSQVFKGTSMFTILYRSSHFEIDEYYSVPWPRKPCMRRSQFATCPLPFDQYRIKIMEIMKWVSNVDRMGVGGEGPNGI